MYTVAMPSQRYDIAFIGRVQGVGFRYSTCRVAERFDVTGWVRNENDGSVRCVVEGESAELDDFVNTVCETMAGNISEARIDKQDATGEFTSFAVRY